MCQCDEDFLRRGAIITGPNFFQPEFGGEERWQNGGAVHVLTARLRVTVTCPPSRCFTSPWMILLALTHIRLNGCKVVLCTILTVDYMPRNKSDLLSNSLTIQTK